jgi:(p)ppGpp synthase/HD superfamily hydrolase
MEGMMDLKELRRNDVVLVARAADFAARRHSGQRRKGAAREPYLNHLAEVALLLAEARDDPDPSLVAAGWLHDSLEDTPTTRVELETLFGNHVAEIVVEVTDDTSLPAEMRKRQQVDLIARKSPAARQIKIADKVSNLRALAISPPVGWSASRALAYVEFSKNVVDRCCGLNSELERRFAEAESLAREAIARML